MAEDTSARRRVGGLGSTALLGLAAGIAAAVAGNQDWVSVDDAGSGDAAFVGISVSGDLTAPPVTATALVLLATWGVVLVSRGRVRRLVAALGLVAALAVLGFAVAAWLSRPGEVSDAARTLDLAVGRTAWAHLGVVAGAVAVASSVLAVLRTPTWPEMGRRYDAPTAAPAPEPAVGEQSSLDLWKALDEGHDPTLDPDD